MLHSLGSGRGLHIIKRSPNGIIAVHHAVTHPCPCYWLHRHETPCCIPSGAGVHYRQLLKGIPDLTSPAPPTSSSLVTGDIACSRYAQLATRHTSTSTRVKPGISGKPNPVGNPKETASWPAHSRARRVWIWMCGHTVLTEGSGTPDVVSIAAMTKRCRNFRGMPKWHGP